MTAVRRGQGPLNLDLSDNAATSELPRIAALFLIYFDIKAGYTIAWKRAIRGLDIQGVVEYKSLPSGLHTVKEDLIYFVHENHAGVSAFVNAPAGEENRNARMIAVGALVPLSYGRLGRSWKHAEMLKELASGLIIDADRLDLLEDYWEKHKAEDTASTNDDETSLDSPSSLRFKPDKVQSAKSKSHGNNRSVSDGTVLLPPEHKLSAYHPAWSLMHLLETFGPLIFPIHRAALLRKRILITTHAPVQETCNFVYDISVLSNIPLAVNDLLTPTAPPSRFRPLFSIGVYDIPLLEEDLRISRSTTDPAKPEHLKSLDEAGNGWIACTTDSILAMKPTLYDVLITLPPSYSENSVEKVWPKVESPQGVEMRATQRDLRRYGILRWGLSRPFSTSSPPSPVTLRSAKSSSAALPEPEPDPQPLPRTTSSLSLSQNNPILELPDTDHITEPLSWSALAYSGFMWWASAGEQRASSDEESDDDKLLLSGLPLSPLTSRRQHSQSTTTLNKTREGIATGQGRGGEAEPEEEDMFARQEMAIIAYFHRLTSQILTTLSDIVDATDSDDEREDGSGEDQDEEQTALDPGNSSSDQGTAAESETGPAVYVTSADMTRMGLDVWSATDHRFVEQIAGAYFGRKARVEGHSIDVCGIRIC